MNERRIVNHPILGALPERRIIEFRFDDQIYHGFESETIAATLLAAGVRTLRMHEETGAPRGIYCNIGHCFECRVTVNGIVGVRACLTSIVEGMDVRSGRSLPTPLKKGGHT